MQFAKLLAMPAIKQMVFYKRNFLPGPRRSVGVLLHIRWIYIWIFSFFYTFSILFPQLVSIIKLYTFTASANGFESCRKRRIQFYLNRGTWQTDWA